MLISQSIWLIHRGSAVGDFDALLQISVLVEDTPVGFPFVVFRVELYKVLVVVLLWLWLSSARRGSHRRGKMGAYLVLPWLVKSFEPGSCHVSVFASCLLVMPCEQLLG